MSGTGDRIRVLHVDDEPALADLATTFLEREDARFEVDTATSAADGLARLAEDDFDCIVSDYDMPGRNGIEFLAAVREESPDLPFILYTGKGSEEVASEAISAGVTDYLQKTSGTEQYELLANRITNAVEQARTEQRLQEQREELERQNELFKRAQDIADVGAWSYDPRTGDGFLSDKIYEIYGLPPGSEITPERSLEFYHPDDRPVIRDAFERAVTAGEPYDLEVRLGDAAGDHRWVRVRADPTLEDGTVVSIQGTLQDITDRRQRRAELERYERIIRNLPVGVFRTTADGEFVDMNERYVSLFGAGSAADFADVEAQDFWVDSDERDALLRQLDREGVVEDRQVEVETLDGERKWVETTLRITEEEGARYLDGIVQDVTERRDRRRRLEQAETMFENARDALFLVDVADEFRVERVNPAYEAATGFSNDAVSGLTPRDIRGEEQGADIERRFRECVTQRTVVEYERELTVDGERTYWETRIAPVVIEDTVEKIVGATRDVTERTRRERRLARQNERFDEVASVVSHDLQTPLSTARGRAELAIETGDVEQMERALAALERADELRANLVEVLRRKGIVGETEPVEVGRIGGEAWETIGAPASSSFRVSGAPAVEADPGALRRLLENLLSDAVEHGAPDGDGAVTVRLGETADGFHIEDDGPGIPADEPEAVLTPGYSTKSGGSGVGLASVRRIVTAHDREIRIRDGEMGGARVETATVDDEDG